MAGEIIISVIIILGVWLLFETYSISYTCTAISIDALPSALNGLRIIHLSDLHGKKLTRSGRLLQKIRGARPDIIAITGDYVHKRQEEILAQLEFFQELTQIAPVYGVAGNHDYQAGWPYISAHLKKAGVRVLENSSNTLNLYGEEVVIAGVDDASTGRDCLETALPAAKNGTVIMLAHSPTWFERLYKAKEGKLYELEKLRGKVEQISLTLAGHTHGGQIKLPLIGAIITGKGNWFPKRYIEGLYREGSGWLYINRGLGQGRPLPLRFLSRPEVSLLILRRNVST